MRINKYFSNLGICSRRETNRLIEEKRVIVNGVLCEPGQWVEEEDEILLDGVRVKAKEKIYIALNKPTGVTCTAADNVKNNIIDYIYLYLLSEAIFCKAIFMARNALF